MKDAVGSRITRGRAVRRPSGTALSACVVVALLFSQALAGVASAAATSISSVAFSGGAGTALVAGTFFVRTGAALTLTVVTDPGANCVTLTGAHSGTATAFSSSTATSRTWTFSLVALSGADGTRTTTVTASADPACATADATAASAYAVDNTAPTVTGTLSPAPNISGWNSANATVTWAATDAGSGVASGPTPASDAVSVETGGVVKSSTAVDSVGNTRTSSVTVKLDKTAPSITGTRAPAANANGWNNTNVTVSFTCADARSGIRTCSGPTSFSSNVSGQAVTGTAVDFAGNTSASTVLVNVDKNAPTISGAVAGTPNDAGWFNGDVTVSWTCADTGGSGFAAGACADSVITGEGTGLVTTRSVTDLAGNSSAVATSAPVVNIDRTPPTTTASAVPTWSTTDVDVSLTATDSLSGLATTFYSVDGAPMETYDGTAVVVAGDGTHSLEYWSQDVAGNVETHQSVTVNVDGTAPMIVGSSSPGSNSNGWNNSDVTVSFTCSDATSGVASCPADQTVSGEGADQQVTGVAQDVAGNSASATVTVSIDKTAPTIAGSVSPPANASGWNNGDVVVTFTCGDALSGVQACADPQTVSMEGAGQSVDGAAADVAGNSASTTIGNINIDKTAPLVSVVGVVDGGTYVAGAYSASCATGDALSGVAAQAVLSSSGGPTGRVVLTCRGASDLAGNAAPPVSVSINVNPAVRPFVFGGFQQPIVAGKVNAVNSGAAVPIKFSLGGYRGMAIFAGGSPASVGYTCSSTPPATATEVLATNGGLTYDASADTYALVWKTAKAWSGCRMLELRFVDGSVAHAYFNFK